MSRLTKEQKEMLFQFLIEHPDLVRCRFGNEFPKEAADNLWQEVTHKLNSLGTQKDWRQWKTCWRDLKSNLKKKTCTTRRFGIPIGDGSLRHLQITRLEEQLMQLIEAENGDTTAGNDSTFHWNSEDSANSTLSTSQMANQGNENHRPSRSNRRSRSQSRSVSPQSMTSNCSMPYQSDRDKINCYLEEAMTLQREQAEEERKFRNDLLHEVRSIRNEMKEQQESIVELLKRLIELQEAPK